MTLYAFQARGKRGLVASILVSFKTQRLPCGKTWVSLLDDELAQKYILPQATGNQPQKQSHLQNGSCPQMSELGQNQQN